MTPKKPAQQTVESNNMQIRDIFALPFLFLGLLLNAIAILIGGEWTAKKYIGKSKIIQ